ncbi:MAG: DUF975 family protein [Ruminococcaceae bacterium]|nr:DUF975 family protein [Oscillospiraceae bacterium]
MDRISLKERAKEQIRGKIWDLFLVTLVVSLITGAVNGILTLLPGVGTVGAMVITAPLSISVFKIYLDLVNENKTPVVADAFYGYSDFGSSVLVVVIAALFTFLWSLLFVIPGIVKALSYSQAYYIIAENKGMPAIDAINRSKEMMRGHKMDYFVLQLSFIGWGLLGVLTFGIAFIWIAPYMNATYANFYNSVKSSYNAGNVA